jgi:hypothetical protein
MALKVSKTIYPKEMGKIKEVKHWSNTDRKKFFTNYNQTLIDYLIYLNNENYK